MITLAVTGHDLANGSDGVSAVMGGIGWDSSLLALDAVDAGSWFKQGGAPIGCCSQPAAAGSTFTFSVSRADDSRITGSGEVFLLRLKPKAGVASGTSAIRFSAYTTFPNRGMISLYPLNPSAPLQVERYYGGTVTIR